MEQHRVVITGMGIYSWNVVEMQLVVLDRKLVLREVERLFDEVDVLVFHDSFKGFVTIRLRYMGRTERK